jgi:hypothetical protein
MTRVQRPMVDANDWHTVRRMRRHAAGCVALRGECTIDGQPYHDTAKVLHISAHCLSPNTTEKMACAVEPDNNNSSSALYSVHTQ